MDACEVKSRIDNYFEYSAIGSGGEGGGKQSGKGSANTERYPPTMAGLAVALGMTREELLALKGGGEGERLVAFARSKVEAYAEEKLFDRGMATGAKFALAHNFPGWDENGGQPTDLMLLSDEELNERIRQLDGE